MKLKSFFRDPIVEKVLVGVVVAFILGFAGWFFGGWQFFGKAWDFLLSPVETWRWSYWLMTVLVMLLACLQFRRLLIGRPLYHDDNDAIAQLIDWIGHYPDGISGVTINYRETDRRLRLARGLTQKHIATAAGHYGYRPTLRGKETIIFAGGH